MLPASVGCVAWMWPDSGQPIDQNKYVVDYLEEEIKKQEELCSSSPEHFTTWEKIKILLFMSPCIIFEEMVKRLFGRLHWIGVLVLPLYEWVYVYPTQRHDLRAAVVVMHCVAAVLPFWWGVVLHTAWNLGATHVAKPSRRDIIEKYKEVIHSIDNSRYGLTPSNLDEIAIGLIVRWGSVMRGAVPSTVGDVIEDGQPDITHDYVAPRHPRAVVVDGRITRLARENTGCPICQEEVYTMGRRVRMLQCGHMLHELCFDQLMETEHHACPVCRQGFRPRPPRVPRDMDENDLAAVAQLLGDNQQPVAGLVVGGGNNGGVRPDADVPNNNAAGRASQQRDPQQQRPHHAAQQMLQHALPSAPGQPPPNTNVEHYEFPGGEMLENNESRTLVVRNWKIFRVPNLIRYSWWSWMFGLPQHGDAVMQYDYYPESGHWYQDGWRYIALPEGLVYELSRWWMYREHSNENYRISVVKLRICCTMCQWTQC